MFSLGAAGTFIEDWAVAASTTAEVVGITRVRSMPVSARPVGPNMALGEVVGFPVVFIQNPRRIRPKRLARRLNNRVEVMRTLPAARYLEREFGPIDIIHSHFYAGSGAVPTLAKRLHVPFVHTEHSSRLVADPSFAGSSHRAMEELFGSAAAVMFVGADQMDFVRGLGINGNFEVMPNPVDDRLFQVGSSDYPEEVRLITVGNLIPMKRQALLLEAMAAARAKDPRLTLDLVGSGESQPQLEALSERLGIAKSVRFRGRVERSQVAELLARSDIYVHASATETFGVAIVEALFAGLPVIVAEAGGVTGSIPASMGIRVDTPEAQKFSAAILDVTRRLSIIRRDVIAAEARSLFSAGAVTDRLGQIYREATLR
jgi:glycosyltransferase involved in cell wall biosynthesis